MEKPGDFFIGVINFFAVLLPGALLCFFSVELFQQYITKRPDIFGHFQLTETQQWVLFILASYILGQFVFLLGSPIDGLYDAIRKICIGSTAQLSKANPLVQLLHNELKTIAWGKEKWHKNQRLFESAEAIKAKFIEQKEPETVNTFQWAKARIKIHHPAAMVEIERHEADQKFFRSLIIVLLLICLLLVFAYHKPLQDLFPYLILMALSFWRYIDQRRKSSSLAYTYLLAAEKTEIATSASPGDFLFF